jgi:hypothetical protein
VDQLSKLFGSIFGLSAFNAASRIVTIALISMMVCYVVGTLLGMIAERIVAEHARGYADARTIPVVTKEEVEQASVAESVDKVREVGRAG